MDTNDSKRQESRVRTEAKPSAWLRHAADQNERAGNPVTAMMFRNEAFRLEKNDE
jgi:hypothetical protein